MSPSNNSHAEGGKDVLLEGGYIPLLKSLFFRRYRDQSLSMAVERSVELTSSDDLEGAAVWRQVAHQIVQLAAAEGHRLDKSEEGSHSSRQATLADHLFD